MNNLPADLTTTHARDTKEMLVANLSSKEMLVANLRTQWTNVGLTNTITSNHSANITKNYP